MDDLTEPEQRVWDAFPESRPTDLAGAPVLDGARLPALTAGGWVLASTIIAGTSRVLARQ
ncbi:hypothetical protein AB0J52_29085 [Spirillospora sp. NPDC049652]